MTTLLPLQIYLLLDKLVLELKMLNTLIMFQMHSARTESISPLLYKLHLPSNHLFSLFHIA